MHFRISLVCLVGCLVSCWTLSTTGLVISDIEKLDMLDETGEDIAYKNGTYNINFWLSDPNSKAAYPIDFGTNPNTSTVYRLFARPESSIFKLNIVLESMVCIQPNLNGSSPETGLRIQGSTGNSELWCKNETYSANTTFADTTYAGEEYFEITLEGDWSLSSAVIVATVYQEVVSCDACDENSFCCEGLSCSGNQETRQLKTAKCVRAHLACDGHINCGTLCNDESADFCSKDNSYYYYFDISFSYMTLLVICFFILVPTFVLTLICYHRHAVATQRARREEARRRRNESPVSTSPPNDHPPTYDEVQDTREPPPSFSDAVKVPNVPFTQEGIENPSFSSEHSAPLDSRSRGRKAQQPAVV